MIAYIYRKPKQNLWLQKLISILQQALLEHLIVSLTQINLNHNTIGKVSYLRGIIQSFIKRGCLIWYHHHGKFNVLSFLEAKNMQILERNFYELSHSIAIFSFRMWIIWSQQLQFAVCQNWWFPTSLKILKTAKTTKLICFWGVFL